jgi:lantibiotic biosynthesis protein
VVSASHVTRTRHVNVNLRRGPLLAVAERVIWKPALTGDLAAEAVRVARVVSNRVASREAVAEAARVAHAQTGFPQTNHWVHYSVAQGYAGLALLWSYLDTCFPGESWDIKGREHLELACRGAESYSYVPLGLFSGLSGLAFAAWQLSRGGTRYRGLLAKLDDTIAPQTMALANVSGQQSDGRNVGDFDAISGLSGVGAYLLCRRDQPLAMEALQALVGALVSLLELEEDGGVPRWYTPADQLYDDEVRQTYPHGNLNCGLAHGVPGILALLSLCLREGVSCGGLSQALERTADWICRSRADDEWGVNWPTAVPLEKVETSTGRTLRVTDSASAPHGPSRCAWCYGAPGIARALWLAGEALGRNDYRELAISAMEAVCRRPVAQRGIPSPTFCHGISGLLEITLRFANDTDSPVFSEESRKLTQQLLGLYSPDFLLGFRNLEVADREVDQPGLLDGAPGVALALLAAAAGVEPTWDRLFLLS